MASSKVVKDKPSPTNEFLTKYEKTKVIALRAEQLARGAQPFVEFEAGEAFDPYEVALRELEARRLPFVIVRHLPDGSKEHLRIDRMTARI